MVQSISTVFILEHLHVLAQVTKWFLAKEAAKFRIVKKNGCTPIDAIFLIKIYCLSNFQNKCT